MRPVQSHQAALALSLLGPRGCSSPEHPAQGAGCHRGASPGGRPRHRGLADWRGRTAALDPHTSGGHWKEERRLGQAPRARGRALVVGALDGSAGDKPRLEKSPPEGDGAQGEVGRKRGLGEREGASPPPRPAAPRNARSPANPAVCSARVPRQTRRPSSGRGTRRTVHASRRGTLAGPWPAQGHLVWM